MAYARALENPDLFMRQVVLLFIGLVVGASSGIAVVNTLRQRDAYPRGLMDVMQHHYAALRDDTRRGHCELSAHHLDMLRNLAGGPERACAFQPGLIELQMTHLQPARLSQAAKYC